VFSDKNKILMIMLSTACLATFNLDIYTAILILKYPNVSEFLAIKSEVISLYTISAGGMGCRFHLRSA